MEDDKIIALYWARKEEAISETDRKYGSYCRSISFRILNDKEDSEECVNDTWLHTWNAIPPGKPEFLASGERAYLLKKQYIPIFDNLISSQGMTFAKTDTEILKKALDNFSHGRYNAYVKAIIYGP